MKRGCRFPRRASLPLARYITPSLAPPLAAVHNGAPGRVYPMLGNDVHSDCVEAAGLHAVQDWAGPSILVPTEAQALADYAVAAGYDAANQATDNGTDPSQYRAAWAKGLPGAGKIAGFVQLDPADATQMQLAIQHFGGVLFCAELPDMAEDVARWFQGTCIGQPGGGHAVWINGYDGLRYDIVTWGQYRPASMDHAFATFYGFAGYAAVPQDWMTPGRAPAGIDQSRLLADLARVGAI